MSTQLSTTAIDGKQYSVDANSLDENDFDDRADVDMDEFFAE
jgi:hypothetical protein